MVSWPCLLKLNGDDELIYLSSEQEFLSVCLDIILTDDDYVIDSAGLSYRIESVLSSTGFTLIKAERELDAVEVTHLIRSHEFKKSELCLTKIHFLTVSDAIKALS